MSSYAAFQDYGTYEDAGVSCVVVGETRPVAKQEHKCSLCSNTIEPGQRYRRFRLIVDGEPTVQKECPSCVDYIQGQVGD